MPDLTGKKAVLIIAHKKFRDEEFKEPRRILSDAGADVTVASSSLDEAKGMLGYTVKPDILISNINVDDYDAVIFIGGQGASEYFKNETAHQIARQTYEKGKLLAAICIAPSTLANAGILEGKNATSYFSEKGNLKKHGANYTGKNVEIDGNIITGIGPKAAEEFGKALADYLAQ